MENMWINWKQKLEKRENNEKKVKNMQKSMGRIRKWKNGLIWIKWKNIETGK